MTKLRVAHVLFARKMPQPMIFWLGLAAYTYQVGCPWPEGSECETAWVFLVLLARAVLSRWRGLALVGGIFSRVLPRLSD